MPTDLANRVWATMRRHSMTAPGDRVAVAVSGGGDSVALLLLLDELRGTLGLTLIVAHLNHRLRGAAADEDERFVGELAAARGFECVVRGEDVAGEARRAGNNLEEEARNRRYAFFRELVSAGRATRVATGHTADDQAETLLSRLGRGAGLRGLAGIHPVLGPVVRPLLEVRRGPLRQYLAACGQPWREDETNRDESQLRARLRRRLLPAFEAECGEGVVERLAGLAELARRDEALLETLVGERVDSLIEREDGSVAVRAGDLADPLPGSSSREAREALAARLARRLAQEAHPDLRGLTRDHVARVLALARQGTSGQRVVLPEGLVAERVLDRVVFAVEDFSMRRAGEAIAFSYPVDLRAGGEWAVEIAETSTRVRLKLIDWPPPGSETYGEWSGALDADRVEPPLVLRNWLPGDAYRPHGRGHVEKLKRLLLERRIAGKLRAGWPVLASAGHPVWASGLPVAAEVVPGPATRRALLVEDGRRMGSVARRERAPIPKSRAGRGAHLTSKVRQEPRSGGSGRERG